MNVAQQIAGRLSESLILINKALPQFDQMDIPQIADKILHYDSFEQVEGYFDGTLAQPFKFLQDYSEAFGVSYEWLRSGEGKPFPMIHARSLEDYKDELEKARPRSIYFVLEESEKKRAVLVLKISEYCYRTLGNSGTYLALRNKDHSWSMGGEGKSDILCFFDLICLAYDELKKGGLEDVSDYEIDSKTWDALVSGDICPLSAIPRVRDGGTNWADDLRDFNQAWLHGDESYEQLHGKWFVETQNYIKEHPKDK